MKKIIAIALVLMALLAVTVSANDTWDLLEGTWFESSLAETGNEGTVLTFYVSDDYTTKFILEMAVSTSDTIKAIEGSRRMHGEVIVFNNYIVLEYTKVTDRQDNFIKTASGSVQYEIAAQRDQGMLFLGLFNDEEEIIYVNFNK